MRFVDALARRRGTLSTVVARHARLEIDEDRFAPYKVIGELGARPLPVYVARHLTPGSAGSHVVVAERFVGGGDESCADFRREARRISTLANQHLARVREVVVRGQDLIVFGDFIDGEKLGALWPLGAGTSMATSGARSQPHERLPLEIALRLLLDVLTGVSALHALRDARQQPMKLMHGEISPATILVGLDGVARILHAVSRRVPEVRAEAASLDYLAPEIHSNGSHDGRADVFSVGVLLWETLAGTALSAAQDGPAGLHVRSGAMPAPALPENTPWAKGLLPVVAKALAAAPEDRWQTAAAMAAEIRKAAGLKLAPASAATAFAKNKFGERVKARRARLESLSTSVPPLPAASVVPASLAGAAASVVPASLAGAAASVVPASLVAVAPAVAARPLVAGPSAGVPYPALPEESASAIVLESYAPPELPPLVSADLPLLTSPEVSQFSHDDVPSLEASAAEVPAVFDEPLPFDEFEEPASVAQAPAVVFSAPLGISTAEEPLLTKRRSRRLLFGGAAAGIVLASLMAFRVVHRSPPPAASLDAQAAVVPAPNSVVPLPPIPSASAAVAVSPPPAPSALPSATHDGTQRTKAGTKGKIPPAAPTHTKASPVRAPSRRKP